MKQLFHAASIAALAFAISACDGISGGAGPGQISAPAPTPSPTPTPTGTPTPTPSPTPVGGVGLELSGDIMPAHDPTIIRDGDTYYLFTTGAQNDQTGMLPLRSSTDLRTWTWHGAALPALPTWMTDAVPGTGGIWAPHIVRRNGEFRLYYSVSTFGRNQSFIGLMTTNALNTSNPSAGWTDRGIVMRSNTTDNFNAIDAAVFTDADGREWMAFGSFWSGIRMVELDPATGLRLAGDTEIRSLASREYPNAVEAPYIIRRGEYYYLFASYDTCCQGADSTYNTRVGRSTSPTGPYLDATGRSMMDGGGTLVLDNGRDADLRFVGRGHVAVLQDGDRDYIVYHGYDRQRNGAPTLRINTLRWTADGWPVAE